VISTSQPALFSLTVILLSGSEVILNQLLNSVMRNLRNIYNDSISIHLLRKMNNQLNLVPSSLDPPFSHFEQQTDLRSAFQKDKLQSKLVVLSGKRVFFRSDFSKETIPLQELGDLSSSSEIPYRLREINCSSRERTVVGIDSSCALIGETDDGAIYAGRVAIVYASRSKIIKYCRAGPIIFYLDPSTLQEELGTHFPSKAVRLVLYDRTIAERLIRIRLERMAQIEVSKNCSDIILLVDGSLRSSILEPKCLALKDLERCCEENFNQLLGISKTTSLRFISRPASALLLLPKSQVYVEITDSVRALYPGIESRVLLSKFSSNSQVFRVDFSYKNSENEGQVLSDLIFNDLLFRGYPETLRLAHHLSVFHNSMVSFVRSYLSSKCGIIQVPSDDLRATILGRLV